MLPKFKVYLQSVTIGDAIWPGAPPAGGCTGPPASSRALTMKTPAVAAAVVAPPAPPCPPLPPPCPP